MFPCKSGWWFKDCLTVNLNGPFETGMQWQSPETGKWIHVTRSRMSLKRRQVPGAGEVGSSDSGARTQYEIEPADSDLEQQQQQQQQQQQRLDLQGLLQTTHYDISKKSLLIPGALLFTYKIKTVVLHFIIWSSFIRTYPVALQVWVAPLFS